MPQGVEELVNIRFLSIDAKMLEMLPRGLLLKLGHLQHLNFPLHIQLPMEEIENLKQLQELSGGVENVNDFNCFITNRVIDTFRIGVGCRYTTRYIAEEEVFGSYSNELRLCECNLKDEKVLGQEVVYLTISRCLGVSMCFVDGLSQLNNPTSLKRLKISYCGGIEWILRSGQGLESQLSKSLERIEVVGLEDLKGLIQKAEEIGASAGPAQPVYSSLRRIKISFCDKIRKPPSLKSFTLDGVEK